MFPACMALRVRYGAHISKKILKKMEDVQNNYKCDLEAGENTFQGQNERVQSVISPKREPER